MDKIELLEQLDNLQKLQNTIATQLDNSVMGESQTRQLELIEEFKNKSSELRFALYDAIHALEIPDIVIEDYIVID